MQKNPVCFWELASHDAEAFVEFLRNVFDWDISLDRDLGFYTISEGQETNVFSGGGVISLSHRLCRQAVHISVSSMSLRG
ncbi:hypothetical protein ES703_93746 [subsurface metagenome]